MNEEKKIANGVIRRNCFWGHFIEGTKKYLIAAGLAKPDWFPDGVERNKFGKVIRQRCLDNEGQEVKCRAFPGSRGPFTDNTKFCIDFVYSEDERERAWAMKAYEEAAAEQRKELTAMPSSHEQFRERGQRFFSEALDVFLDYHGRPTKYHGYAYTPEVIEKLELKSQEFLEILATGKTLYSAQRHQARIQEIQGRTAAADPALRKFLDEVTKQS